MFQAASGLSYTTDMAKLVPTDFQVTEDGQYYIHDKRNKTGVFYTAVILEQGVEILKKYNFKLPMLGNHKMNVYLKTIRDLCGIDKPIFSHVARHTYATWCLNRGLRLEVVAKLLGCSTTRITQHYAKLLQNNILNEVKDVLRILLIEHAINTNLSNKRNSRYCTIIFLSLWCHWDEKSPGQKVVHL